MPNIAGRKCTEREEGHFRFSQTQRRAVAFHAIPILGQTVSIALEVHRSFWSRSRSWKRQTNFRRGQEMSLSAAQEHFKPTKRLAHRKTTLCESKPTQKLRRKRRMALYGIGSTMLEWKSKQLQAKLKEAKGVFFLSRPRLTAARYWPLLYRVKCRLLFPNKMTTKHTPKTNVLKKSGACACCVFTSVARLLPDFIWK